MRVALGAPSVTVAPGGAAELAVEVFNERTVIDGVSARVMGLDAQWVKSRPGRLALFPDTAGTIELRITVPEEFPAGTHAVESCAIGADSLLSHGGCCRKAQGRRNCER